MNDSRLLLGLVATLVSMVALTVPGTAAAQDDDSSSDAYADDNGGPAPPLRRDVYDAGKWSIGVDGLFSRTSTRAEVLEDNAEARDTTRFLRLDTRLTVGVVDRVHVGVLTGLISRRLNQAGADATTENAVAAQPIIQYIGGVTRRLGLYAEVAPGMYFGSSERTIPVEDQENVFNEEETQTMGFVLTAGTGVSYRLSEGLQLRFGLTFNGLWGREEVEAVDDTLSSSTTNYGTSAGFRYTF